MLCTGIAFHSFHSVCFALEIPYSITSFLLLLVTFFDIQLENKFFFFLLLLFCFFLNIIFKQSFFLSCFKLYLKPANTFTKSCLRLPMPLLPRCDSQGNSNWGQLLWCPCRHVRIREITHDTVLDNVRLEENLILTFLSLNLESLH